ncbi:hypothetical protein AKJ09_08960 [Labilithrix luteola]|uniref:Uncharacterized protein n=1 Tax=Labilithrix luteola TaxID=1391654 RepID=A0A0K1Q9G1_9BACT|nr:hypothetical protein AKJ09_08960 [Labilithrix luteola]
MQGFSSRVAEFEFAPCPHATSSMFEMLELYPTWPIGRSVGKVLGGAGVDVVSSRRVMPCARPFG